MHTLAWYFSMAFKVKKQRKPVRYTPTVKKKSLNGSRIDSTYYQHSETWSNNYSSVVKIIDHNSCCDNDVTYYDIFYIYNNRVCVKQILKNWFMSM